MLVPYGPIGPPAPVNSGVRLFLNTTGANTALPKTNNDSPCAKSSQHYLQFASLNQAALLSNFMLSEDKHNATNA
jgi:hypothetical protein